MNMATACALLEIWSGLLIVQVFTGYSSAPASEVNLYQLRYAEFGK